MKILFSFLIFLFITDFSLAQETDLNYFLQAAEKNNPTLLQNNNLNKIAVFNDELITAENSSFQVDATSEVMVAPYFNNNGNFLAITTTPSAYAYGYAEPVSNGSLYSAQLNITKEIFNRAKLQNLVFQNTLNEKSRQLSNTEIVHQLHKNITAAYIQVYQLQSQKIIAKDLISDLENRLKVLEILVKKGILMQSDYLLLQLEIDTKKLEIQQLDINLAANLLVLNNAVGIKSAQIQHLSEPLLPLDLQLEEYLKLNHLQYDLSSTTSVSSNGERSTSELKNIPFNKEDTSKAYLQRKFEIDSLQLVSEQSVFNNKYKPQLTAYGTTGLNAVAVNEIPHNIGFSAGLRLIVPIYDGGQRKIRSLQNEYKTDNLKLQLQSEKLIKTNTLESLEQQISGVYEGLQLIELQLQKQHSILEIYKGKMVQGQVSIIDYLKVIENYKMNLDTKLQMQINLWLLQNEFNTTNW